jgi:type I restriction enzyme S subunit
MIKPFRDFVTLQRGFDLPKTEMHGGQYPVVGSTSVIGFHNEYKVEPPGVLTGRSGSLGTVQYVEEPYWPHNTSLWVKDFKSNDPRFVYYCLQGLDFGRFNAGAGVPTLNRNHLDTLEVEVPDLPTQRRLAGILAAYDELIANNQQRIRILEEMARALFREWFVHFRFPGHEKLPRVASPLGDIPTGWELKRLSSVAEVNSAQISVRDAPEELHYIDISSVSPGQIETATTYAFADAPGRARRIVQHGDVLWSCVRPNRRSHAQVMHPEPNTIASTGFSVLTARQVPFTFLYAITTTDDFVAYLTNNATGAAYPAVTAATFEKADLIIPSAPLLKKFGEATTPMAEQTHTLQRQIQILRRTRDLLLPRLLSGGLVLNDVEILKKS